MNKIHSDLIFTPRACARGKEISCVVIIVVSTRISISQGLGTRETSKQNESVAFDENGLQCASNRGTCHDGPRASQKVPFC